MSLINKTAVLARVVLPRCIRCFYSTDSGSSTQGGAGSQTETPAPTPVTPPPEPAPAAAKPAEPFDNTKYGSAEFYTHNEMSFYDIESAMESKRVGQPSSKTN